MPLYAKLALDLPRHFLDAVYDYQIPDEWHNLPLVGCRVRAPFGRGDREIEGVVLSVSASTSQKNIKAIAAVLDSEPLLSDKDIQLVLWVRERFFSSFYAVLRAMLPAGLWLVEKAVVVVCEQEEAIAASACAQEPEALALWRWLRKQQKPVTQARAGQQFGDQMLLESLRLKGLVEIRQQHAPRLRNQTERLVTLSPDFAVKAYCDANERRAPIQIDMLKLLMAGGPTVSWHELQYYTGATTATLNALEKMGAVSITVRESYRRPTVEPTAKTIEQLTDSQQAALAQLLALREQHQCKGALLHGVTGSGKTAVYIKLIESVLAQGGGALVLVPEIALTPQMVAIFTNHFGSRIAMLNSGLTLAQRHDEWKRVKNGQADVVVGTRSAVFAPLRSLSLVIMDEEHETTYKSEADPRYYARDIAKFRCHQHNALLVLGSATPSVESMYAARNGDIELVTLPGRFNAAALPPVTIADLRADLEAGREQIIGRVLEAELRANVERGEQSILFVNRRGRDRMQVCAECGQSPECSACSSALVYHSANRRMMCHYCGYSQPAAAKCPSCGGYMKSFGFGTQRVVEELAHLFPGQSVLRMDTDTTGRRGAHEELLKRFREERTPFLIGTQMVTKGLDFENVTLVGVLAADNSLFAADYRAHERTFALITQVVGRAGRGQKVGRAVLQTFNKQNAVLQASAAQDYEAFYQAELPLRQARELPPFNELIALRLSGRDQAEVQLAAQGLAQELAKELPGLDLHGPAPALLFRHQYLYRYQITLCGHFDRAVRNRLTARMTAFSKANKTVYIYADYQPNSL